MSHDEVASGEMQSFRCSCAGKGVADQPMSTRVLRRIQAESTDTVGEGAAHEYQGGRVVLMQIW